MTNETETLDRVATPEEVAAADAADAKKNVSIAILCPPEFKKALSDIAETRGQSLMELARQALAATFGLTLPPAGERRVKRKYATAEEREVAQKVQAKSRRDKMAAILKAFENADPALKAQILANAGVPDGGAPTSEGGEPQ